jgi:hypothetical protein
VGHTHRAEQDLNSKFIASGIINYEIAEYITITKNGINLIKEQY